MKQQPWTQTLGPYHFEAAQLLRVRVGVCAVWQQAGVIAVDYVVDLVLGEQLLNKLRRQVVRHVYNAGQRKSRSERGYSAEDRRDLLQEGGGYWSYGITTSHKSRLMQMRAMVPGRNTQVAETKLLRRTL
jgi:hypothetical protein